MLKIRDYGHQQTDVPDIDDLIYGTEQQYSEK